MGEKCHDCSEQISPALEAKCYQPCRLTPAQDRQIETDELSNAKEMSDKLLAYICSPYDSSSLTSVQQIVTN